MKANDNTRVNFMKRIAEGEGRTSNNFNYRWSLEDTDDGGCSVSAYLDCFSVVRSFPAMVTHGEAQSIAEQLAPSLELAISSYS